MINSYSLPHFLHSFFFVVVVRETFTVLSGSNNVVQQRLWVCDPTVALPRLVLGTSKLHQDPDALQPLCVLVGAFHSLGHPLHLSAMSSGCPLLHEADKPKTLLPQSSFNLTEKQFFP